MSPSDRKGERLSVTRPDERPTTVRSKRRIIRRRQVPRRPVRSTNSTVIAAIASLLMGRPDSADGTGVYSRAEAPLPAFVAVPQQQQQPGAAVQPLRRSGKGAVCCAGSSSSSSLASTFRSARGRGTPCGWRWSPPTSSSSSSSSSSPSSLPLSSLSLSPNCDIFPPRHEAPSGSLLLRPSPFRIRRQHQRQQQQQQQQRRYRHRHSRASWWCSATESEASSAADTATATQQLLVGEEYEGGAGGKEEEEEEEEEEKTGMLRPRPAAAVPLLVRHTSSSTEDNTNAVGGYVEGQLGFVESHGFEPIAGARTAAAAAAAVETKGPSSAIARRRLRQLEWSWLEDQGKDVPFEFAEMRQVRRWKWREAYHTGAIRSTVV